MTDTQVQALTTVNVTPALTNEQHKEYMLQMKNFVKEEMIEGADYGIIPGTKDKTLFDPGAEKLARRYNFVPKFEPMEEIEDFEKGFLFYKYKCIIIHAPTNTVIGEAIRSCNSKEKKYAQYTKAEKWATEEEKSNKIGTKKNEKWGSIDLIIRKSPDEVTSDANTILSMAQKRAFVEAVRTATMTSSIFKGADVIQDAIAPNKSVTREEDPRRAKLNMRLHAAATEHGWTEEWLHKAIEKKWKVDSLTKISNEQMEELEEFITTKYETVTKGERPKLREDFYSEPIGLKEQEQKNKIDNTLLNNHLNKVAKDAEIVEKPASDPKAEVIETKEPAESKPIEYWCKGKKHDPLRKETMAKTTVDKPWCNKECEDSFFGPIKKNSRMEEFIKTGKLPTVNPPVSMG